MASPVLGVLQSQPVLDDPSLVGAPVLDACRSLPFLDEIGAVAIDPALADTAACSETYSLPLESGANCVVVYGRREGEERVAACVVPATTRADVNSLVKRLLDVRKATFLPMERATAETSMEYGGITPLGLPAEWRILVDAALLDQAVVVIGSGVRHSKLLLPGRLLSALPRAEVITDLGRPPTAG